MKIRDKNISGATEIDRVTLEETASGVTDGFPFRSACTDLAGYPGQAFPWHWHNEVELLWIVSGRLRFDTLSRSLELREGDIVFLTGGTTHSSRTVPGYPAVHKEFIFSPLLIAGAPGSEIDRKYVSPVLHAGEEPLLLSAGTPENAAIAPYLMDAYAFYVAGEDGFELRIRHLMDEVWLVLRKELSQRETGRKAKSAGEIRLKTMLSFLQENYGLNVTVADMAAAANISERECSRCFGKQLGITPMDYLMNLRLNRACAMLANTSFPMGEIASACGFSSASYFSRVFRGRFGITPRAYRNGEA